MIPAWVGTEKEQELFARMCFSALVDTDFLDTERHFLGGARIEKENHWTIGSLVELFEERYQQRFACTDGSAINALRKEIYEYCIQAAHLAPGIYRLRGFRKLN